MQRAPVDPTLPVIDSHHHIWNRQDIPWLHGPILPRIFGDYSAMRRDYPIEEFRADLASSGVVKSIYVQANWAPDRALQEVAWVQSVADMHGYPHAIVGYADLAGDDVENLLDRQMRHANLRGIRQQLHWHQNPQYRFADRPDLMNVPAWRRGLKAVADRGLVFDLQVFSGQMADCAALADAFPDLTFVLAHAGMQEDRSDQTLALWRSGMRKLAACRNVYAKLTGPGTFAHRCEVDLWQPIVDETVALFGPRRCMFGSNFPIEKLWTSYAGLVAVARQCLSGYSVADQRAVLHDTAVAVYRPA